MQDTFQQRGHPTDQTYGNKESQAKRGGKLIPMGNWKGTREHKRIIDRLREKQLGVQDSIENEKRVRGKISNVQHLKPANPRRFCRS